MIFFDICAKIKNNNIDSVDLITINFWPSHAVYAIFLRTDWLFKTITYKKNLDSDWCGLKLFQATRSLRLNTKIIFHLVAASTR